MSNNNTRIAVLIGKRLNGSISITESAELNAFMAISDENRHFVEQFDDESYVTKELDAHYVFDVQEGWMKLVERANLPFRASPPVVRFKWLFPAVAAILVLAVLTWIFFNPKNSAETPVTSNKPAITNDVAPGGDRATLQLADGRVIILDSAGTGALATQNGAQVLKTGDGSLKYESKGAGGQVLYNTLSTPKGGQYKVQLPDGSTVYLNATSSIKYPTVFTGNERRVEVTGEVYCSVVKNTSQPFRVYFNEGQGLVEVTGTEFNLNTYMDENDVKTTLIEGQVKVATANSNRESVILKPGEQVALSQSSKLSKPIQVQTDVVTAWKNGFFYFENKTLPEIFKTVSRWYDIDVKYEFEPNDEYRVRIPRSVPISKVLSYLEATGGVHFSIEGKTIIVKK